MTRRSLHLLAAAYLCLAPALAVPGPGPNTQSYLSTPPSAPTVDRYDDEQVWRVDLTSLDLSLRDQLFSTIDILNLDVWKATPSAVDIRLHASQIPLFPSSLSSAMHPFIDDLQWLVDLSSPVSSVGPEEVTARQTGFHDAYHSLEDIYAFGGALINEFNGEDGLEITEFVVGESAEGRQIKGWKARITEEGVEKKTLEFVVQSGQHAREWVGPSTAMYFLHSLLLDVRENPQGGIATLMKSFTFVVVPTINPDGYVYSQQKGRMWRKNRQEVGGKKCLGIDLNRNWDYKWHSRKVTNVCSDNYPGKVAFQAPENRAMANYLANGTDGADEDRTVQAFIDLHSYGQLFMFPFAHSCDDYPPDAEFLMEAGLGVGKAMRSVHGENYQSGQACDLTYRAPGDAIDFSYGVTDVRWSYSAELRDTGTYGFMLPPHLIRPTGEEMTAGLIYLAKFIYVAEIAGFE